MVIDGGYVDGMLHTDPLCKKILFSFSICLRYLFLPFFVSPSNYTQCNW